MPGANGELGAGEASPASARVHPRPLACGPEVRSWAGGLSKGEGHPGVRPLLPHLRGGGAEGGERTKARGKAKARRAVGRWAIQARPGEDVEWDGKRKWEAVTSLSDPFPGPHPQHTSSPRSSSRISPLRGSRPGHHPPVPGAAHRPGPRFGVTVML